MKSRMSINLSTETVKGTTLALEGVDHVERCDCLTLGVLGVGDGIANDGFQEGLEDTAGFFVDHCKETVSKGEAAVKG